MSVSITNTHDVGVQCEQISTEMEDFMNSAIFDVNSNTKDNVPNDILWVFAHHVKLHENIVIILGGNWLK